MCTSNLGRQAFFATLATMARDLDAAHADNLAAAEKVRVAAALPVHTDSPTMLQLECSPAPALPFD
jgi:hypothetical protein